LLERFSTAGGPLRTARTGNRLQRNCSAPGERITTPPPAICGDHMDEKRARLFHLGVGLTSPEIWVDAVETQWARVVEAREALRRLPPFGESPPEERQLEGRLTWEAHLLVIAIRQLLRTQEAFLKETGDHRLVKARAEFDAAVPHAKDFRDFLEHLDRYLRGEGNLQKAGAVATGVDLVVDWGRQTGRVTLRLDEHLLDLGDAAEAAHALAEVTAAVWFEHVMKGMAEAGGSGIIPQ
jgi:hypothetical protein